MGFGRSSIGILLLVLLPATVAAQGEGASVRRARALRVPIIVRVSLEDEGGVTTARVRSNDPALVRRYGEGVVQELVRREGGPEGRGKGAESASTATGPVVLRFT